MVFLFKLNLKIEALVPCNYFANIHLLHINFTL